MRWPGNGPGQDPVVISSSIMPTKSGKFTAMIPEITKVSPGPKVFGPPPAD